MKNTRKLIAVIVCALMCFAMLPFAVNAAETVEIADAAALSAFAADVNAGVNTDAAVKLTADITADADFISIGTQLNPFTGSFDGDGHTVSGIDIAPEGFSGLFGFTSGAAICNVKIASSSFDALSEEGGAYYSGAVVAYAKNTTVTACEVNASVYGDYFTGGIAGYAEGSTITDCVTGPASYIGGYVENCGGIVGAASATTVTGCTNSAYVDGTALAGGIAGSVKGGKIENCVNTGSVSAVDTVAGGIAGASSADIAKCINKGGVKADSKAGGIAGTLTSAAVCESYNTGKVSVNEDYCAGVVSVITDGEIANCYNAGEVAGANSVFAGIFAVMNGGKVSGSYNAGAVSGGLKTYAGIGSKVSGTVENCYCMDTAAKKFISGSDATVISCEILSEGKMTAQESFAGFDFENEWEMDDSHGYAYPVLKAINYHTLSYVSSTAPTCTESGFDSFLCSECNGIVDIDTLPAAGHSWVTLSEKKATCTEDGYGDYVCSVCEEELSEEYTATGHTDANNDGKCDTCGTKLTNDDSGEKLNIFQKIAKFFTDFFNWIRGLFKK